MRPSAMRASVASSRSREPGGDLARLHEVGVGARRCRRPRTARIIAEAVLEVALLDAVDAGLVEQARGRGRPSRGSAARSPMNPSASATAHPEVRGPVDRCRRRRTAGRPRPQRAKASSSWPVRKAAVAQPVEVVDVERVDVEHRESRRQASPQRCSRRPSRASATAASPWQSRPIAGRIRRRTPRPRRAGPRGTSTSRRSGRPRTGTRRRSSTRRVPLPLRPERGVLELGRPAVGAEAELLVELDLAAGHLEDGAEHLEEPADARVVAGHRVRAAEVEHEVVGEDLGQGVVVLVEDRRRSSRSRSSTFGCVVTHGFLPGVVVGVGATVRSGTAPAHRENHRSCRVRRISQFCGCGRRARSAFGRCAVAAGSYRRVDDDRQDGPMTDSKPRSSTTRPRRT